MSQVGNMGGVRNVARIHVFDRLHQDHFRGSFAQGADHFVVVFVTDQDNGVALARELYGFEVNLGDQRTGGINDRQSALFALTPDFRRYAVGAENSTAAIRHLRQFFDKHRAERPQFFHHVLVVYDFLADVHGPPVKVQGNLDDIDRTHHTGAESAGFQKVNLLINARIGSDRFQRHIGAVRLIIIAGGAFASLAL